MMCELRMTVMGNQHMSNAIVEQGFLYAWKSTLLNSAKTPLARPQRQSDLSLCHRASSYVVDQQTGPNYTRLSELNLKFICSGDPLFQRPGALYTSDATLSPSALSGLLHLGLVSCPK